MLASSILVTAVVKAAQQACSSCSRAVGAATAAPRTRRHLASSCMHQLHQQLHQQQPLLLQTGTRSAAPAGLTRGCASATAAHFRFRSRGGPSHGLLSRGAAVIAAAGVAQQAARTCTSGALAAAAAAAEQPKPELQRPPSPRPLVGPSKLEALRRRRPTNLPYPTEPPPPAPPRPAADIQPVRPGPANDSVLAVSVTGVLHKLLTTDSGWSVLRFKEVHHCSNGISTSTGWLPTDVPRALEALGSTSSSTRTTSKQPLSYAARNAVKWLSVTGNVGEVREGSTYKLRGMWHYKDAEYGWQIKCDTLEETVEDADPKSLLTRLPGVGDATAERILQHFGSSTRTMHELLGLDEDAAVAALSRVEKIGVATARKIKRAWDKQQAADDRQAQLQQQLSMSYRLATRLIKYYGADPDLALDQVTKNPYAHCYSMPGYTLDQAEETARALGFNPAAPERGAAYLQSELLDAHSDSKLSLAWSVLEKHTLQRLLNAPFRGWPADQGLRVAAEQLVQDGRVVVEEQQPLQTETAAGADKQQEHRHHRKQQQPEVFEFKQVSSQWLDDAHVYLQEVHQAEQDVVEYFVVGLEECCEQLERLQWQQRRQVAADQQQQQELTAGGTQRGHRQSGKQGAAAAAEALQTASASSSSSSLQLPLTVSAAHADLIDELQQELSQQLGKSVVFNEGQRVALVLAQLLPMVFLSGGPGCGKTLTSQAIVRRWLDESSADELELFMAAPTGRAAVRLQELLSNADSVSSSTIHRLLGYRNNAAIKRMAAEAAAAANGDGNIGNTSVSDLEAELDAVALSTSDLDLGSKCQFNRHNPLPSRAHYLVDEVSMMDMQLSGALLSALSGEGTFPRKLVLVGDPDQLPPVSAGQPVADALAEGLLPCVDLRQIYRTAANSAIVASAHAINKGLRPNFSAVWDINPSNIAADIAHHISMAQATQPDSLALEGGKVLYLRLPDGCAPYAVAAALKETAQQLLPLLPCDQTLDVQALSPIKNGPMGTKDLNSALQQHFNPPAPSKEELKARYGGVWRVGDRVTHLKNDSQLDVFNGDQGYIEWIDPDRHALRVRYPPRSRRGGSASSSSGSGDDSILSSSVDASGGFHRVTYRGPDIADMLQLAWCTTVHKAQGGEFPVVLVALHNCAGRALRRQLFYTAVSRAQLLLVVVGTDASIDRCLKHTGLDHHAEESSRFRLKLHSARVEAGLPRIQKAVYGPEGWS